MKKSKLVPSVVALAALTAAFIVFCGCEDEPSMTDLDEYFKTHSYVSDPRGDPYADGLEISPSNAVIETVGGKAVFTVKGGESPFTWDVSISSAGSIAAQDNDRRAIYTCKVVTNNNVIACDYAGRAAIADISGAVATQALAAALAISPTTASVTNGGFASFTASGGTPPYTWDVTTSYGWIQRKGTDTALYQDDFSTSGGNAVVLADSAGNEAYAVINEL